VLTINQQNITDQNEHETFVVVEYVLHPAYDPVTVENDFMIMRINGSSSFNPVAIDDGSCREIEEDASLTVFGYGDTHPDKESPPDVLLEVDVSYLSNEKCFEDHNLKYGSDIFLCNNMMCAYGDGERDNCHGDSGGPLIVKGGSASQDIQVGVVSWGIECAGDNQPAVYARIANQLDFINETVVGFGKNLQPIPLTPAICTGVAFGQPKEDFCYEGCWFPFGCFVGATVAASLTILLGCFSCCYLYKKRRRQKSEKATVKTLSYD